MTFLDSILTLLSLIACKKSLDSLDEGTLYLTMFSIFYLVMLICSYLTGDSDNKKFTLQSVCFLELSEGFDDFLREVFAESSDFFFFLLAEDKLVPRFN